MSRLRGAVLGCGMVSEFHLRGWARMPELEIVALADPDVSLADERRARFAPSARVYASVGELLASEALDVVDVLTPPRFHLEHALAAKAIGAHVIVQKPISDDLAAARDLVSAFSGGRELLSVHENHAFRPWFRAMAGMVAEGSLGSLRRLRLEQFDPTSPLQLSNRQADRGVLLQYGTHLIDLARQLLGPPLGVAATLARVNAEVRGESLAAVTLRYPDAVASVEVAWTNTGIATGGALLIGDAGEALYEGTMTRGGTGRLRTSHGGAVERDVRTSPTDDYLESFFLVERAFVDSVLNGSPVPVDPARNLETLAITFAAYASAESGREIDYAEFAREHSIAPSAVPLRDPRRASVPRASLR